MFAFRAQIVVGTPRTALLLFLLLGLGACHGRAEDSATPRTGRTVADRCTWWVPASTDLADRLAALPCVASVRELSSENDGYRAFELEVTQLVDHQDPESGTFEEEATLMVRDPSVPMVVYSTGYSNYYGQYLVEPTVLLAANQLTLEHRFFARSIPADPDWSQLTIANAADDEHRIIQSLKPLFPVAWLTSGASKGGMATVFHRRFWPDDVDGSVPYVAPISFGAPDYRYDEPYQALGAATCRHALQDLQVEMLSNRRDMLEARAAQDASDNGYRYTRVALGPAVESAVGSLYWAFWQYYGQPWCGTVPPVSASDDDVWSFLQTISPVDGSDDAGVASFQAYYFQSAFQLGYPGTTDGWLDGLWAYDDSAYDGIYPSGVALPDFQPDAMQDIDGWVRSEGDRLLFVYGEWDPWTGGAFELGDAGDSAKYVVAQGSHYASLWQLGASDQGDAFDKLQRWTGVTPDRSNFRAARSRPRRPRIPPVVQQAWRLRGPAE